MADESVLDGDHLTGRFDAMVRRAATLLSYGRPFADVCELLAEDADRETAFLAATAGLMEVRAAGAERGRSPGELAAESLADEVDGLDWTEHDRGAPQELPPGPFCWVFAMVPVRHGMPGEPERLRVMTDLHPSVRAGMAWVRLTKEALPSLRVGHARARTLGLLMGVPVDED
jgi:hypothetical protein